MIYQDIADLIGKTPVYRVKKIESLYDLKAEVYVKIEFFNPGGSVKDRAAYQMYQSAKKEGRIDENTLIIEPTSGNTGIGLAMLAAHYGHKIILTMPESMSEERRKILKAYGAELVLTPASEGMKGAIAKAEKLASEYDNAWIPSQFDNKANAKAHYLTTGPEIIQDFPHGLDYFVSAVGTGGTLTGVAQAFRQVDYRTKIVAVEPKDSSVLSGKAAGPHKIQGIGAGFVPSILETTLIDEIISISNEDAFKFSRLLAQKEGLLVGISSGSALAAAIAIAQRPENEGKQILAILPDTGERYLSSELFQLD